MCCDTTARQAAHRGFAVTMLSDATAAMDVKGPDGVVIPMTSFIAPTWGA